MDRHALEDRLREYEKWALNREFDRIWYDCVKEVPGFKDAQFKIEKGWWEELAGIDREIIIRERER